MIRLIAAVDRNLGIAKAGVMPWHIPLDERFFSEQTKRFGGHVLSGGVTFRGSYKSRPLTGRHNYILTHGTTAIKGAEVVNNLDKFLSEFKEKDLWVAGGAAVFAEFIKRGAADELYLTHIDAEFGCDRFFPTYKDSFKLVDKAGAREQNGFRFYFARYVKN